MWPMLLDMPKLECKKDLRKLELEAYSLVVSTFRAQGNLTTKKIQILRELESLLRISTDRHKAELRRAVNDEKLYTIAKRLSHGECVTSEWLQQSRRLIPLLPRLQHNSNTSGSSYYRILADHILKTSQSILNLFPEPEETCLSDSELDDDNIKATKHSMLKKRKKHDLINSIPENSENSLLHYRSKSKLKVAKKDQDILYLVNGYSVSSKCVEVENIQPSEFIKKREQSIEKSPGNSPDNSSSFIRYLIQKYKNQNQEMSSSMTTKGKISQPKSVNTSPVQEAVQQVVTNTEHSNKKSTHESNKSSSSGTSTSNKNSKLISQIIEANATKAVQQQLQQQKQQLLSPTSIHGPSVLQSNISSSQQIVLQQLKPMPHAFSISQGDVVSAQLISNGSIILDNSSEKSPENLNTVNMSNAIPANTSSNTSSTNNNNNPVANSNSTVSLNTQSTSNTNNLKPPSAIKISSAQILRLNSPSSPLSAPTQSSTQNLNGPFCSLNQNLNQGVQNTNSASTIVKLTTQPQININQFTKNQFNSINSGQNSSNGNNNNSNPSTPLSGSSSIIQSPTSTVHTNSSFQFFNPTNQQPLKHFVQLPKSAQKLIILPTSSTSSSKQTTMKQNILINNQTPQSVQKTLIPSPILLENSDSSSCQTGFANTPGNQLKIVSSLNSSNTGGLSNPGIKDQGQFSTAQNSSVQKLILCKNFSTNVIESSNNNFLSNSATPNVNSSQISSSTNQNKSLKIVSTTPILSNQIISAQNPTTNQPSGIVTSNASNLLNKSIVFNVSSGLKISNLNNKFNSNSQQIIPLNASSNLPDTKSIENEPTKASSLSNVFSDDSEEHSGTHNATLNPKPFLANQLSDFTAMQPALVASSSVSTVLETTTQVQNELIETTDIEPLNAQIKRKRSISYNTLPTCENTISLCDSYLQYIKEIIAKLNCTTTNNKMTLKEDQKLEIRALCERIKEKLENDSYETMDLLNEDLNKIKNSYSEVGNNGSGNNSTNVILQLPSPLNPQIINCQGAHQKISCFKFDDVIQKPANELELSNGSNKRIRLLNFNLIEKSDELADATAQTNIQIVESNLKDSTS